MIGLPPDPRPVRIDFPQAPLLDAVRTAAHGLASARWVTPEPRGTWMPVATLVASRAEWRILLARLRTDERIGERHYEALALVVDNAYRRDREAEWRREVEAADRRAAQRITRDEGAWHEVWRHADATLREQLAASGRDDLDALAAIRARIAVALVAEHARAAAHPSTADDPVTAVARRTHSWFGPGRTPPPLAVDLPAPAAGAVAPASTGAPSRAAWSEEELLLHVRCGDPAAFGELYSRLENDARRLARSLVDRDDVDDVVAESFTKMLRAIDRGKGPIDGAARYLMVTVRATAMTLYGRRTRQAKIADMVGGTPAEADPAFVVEDQDLVQAFRSLQPRWRQVIWWTEVEGMRPAEVAVRLGINASAASALAYRARRALREAYGEACAASEADLR